MRTDAATDTGATVMSVVLRQRTTQPTLSSSTTQTSLMARPYGTGANKRRAALCAARAGATLRQHYTSWFKLCPCTSCRAARAAKIPAMRAAPCEPCELRLTQRHHKVNRKRLESRTAAQRNIRATCLDAGGVTPTPYVLQHDCNTVAQPGAQSSCQSAQLQPAVRNGTPDS